MADGTKIARAAALIATLMLGSCSSIQLAYGQLDRWLRWQIDDYVDFNRQQKQQLQAALDSFHSWHRQTQLPRYADLLEQFAGRVEEGQLQQLELAPWEEQVNGFWQAASTQLIDLLLPLAPQLSPEQIDELEWNLRKKREESLEKWHKSPQKARQRRQKQISNQGKRWFGPLTGEQESMISTWATRMGYNPLLRDRQRQIWQARFIDLLRRKPDNYLKEIRDLMLNPQQLWSEDYRRMQETRRQQIPELIGQLLASTTEKQRRHMSQTLREYARDCRTLAAQD